MSDGIEAGPSSRARIAGVCYLLTIVTGAFAAVVGGRNGEVANLLASAFYIAVTVLFYRLFKPVNAPVAAIAAVFSLAGCLLGPLHMLHLSESRVDPLVLFGCYCLLIGYLILRSTFLPRFLGVLMAIAGLGWLTFASPMLVHRLAPYNVAPGLMGEGALTMWLLAAGVDEQRWRKKAGTLPHSPSGTALRS